MINILKCDESLEFLLKQKEKNVYIPYIVISYYYTSTLLP